MTDTLNIAPQVAPVLIGLLKGVLYADQQPLLWRDLLTFQGAIRDYFAVIGLNVHLDETEGYAFLRQRPGDDEENMEALPRLVQRRPLSYPVSLLCVLLRKRLIEQDAAGGETRVVLTRNQIVERMRVFLPDSGNEAKTVEQIDRHINRVVEFGFLRRMKGEEEVYEVRRIIKAMVDAEWLGGIDEKLKEYQAHADARA